MIKTITKSFLLTLFAVPLIGQNVGVGTATPATKLNVVQVADVIGIEVDHVGNTGNSIVAFPQNPANASSVNWTINQTAGRGFNLDMALATGTTPGIEIDMDGLGNGMFIHNDNTGAGGHSIFIANDGTDAFSRGLEISMDAANPAIGAAVFHGNANGTAIYAQSPSEGLRAVTTGAAGLSVYGFTSGVDATAGLFNVNSGGAATRNAIGLFVLYDGTNASGGGGGNAVEVQHNGTNGNAVDVFVGTPTNAAGPANTTSDFACISASHMGTGSAATGVKCAINASGYSDDATVFVTNQGTGGGSGISSQTEPNNDGIGVYGYSEDGVGGLNGYGIGVQGYGGWYGVQGWEYQSTAPAWACYGVYATGDMGASGAKTFMIDHPLDPANKALRHYSIESNEITNMYRGVVMLDANGEATVNLPDYFDAINKNISYQLTPIGTGTQPYIAEEEANNQFKVAGAPNTKVSWVVYGERNDPTIQYYNQFEDYKKVELTKTGKFAGKYYVPEAHGQPATLNVHYNAKAEDARIRAKEQKQEAMSNPDLRKNNTNLQPAARPQASEETAEVLNKIKQ